MPGPYDTSDRRLYSQLQLNMPATYVKPKGTFNKALRPLSTISVSPKTPHTPPSSPPVVGRSDDRTEVMMDLTPHDDDQISHEAQRMMLGPAMATTNDSWGNPWDDWSPRSSISQYSDRSIETLRNSSVFTSGPPKVPDMPKTQCAVCKDLNMILFNGTELTCGHFAHRVCLRTAVQKLDGLPPSCAICGEDCVIKDAIKPETATGKCTADPTGSVEETQYEMLGEGLIERDNTANCGTPPLRLQVFVHSQSRTQHELLLKVSAPVSAFEHWRYIPTSEDLEAARRLVSTALGVARLGGSRINAASAGRLRLASVMRDSRTQAKTTGYLFQHAAIFTQITADGFEELVHSVDLDRDDVEIQGTPNSLQINVGDASLVYRTSSRISSDWIAASRNPRLDFPLEQSTSIDRPSYAERSLLHLILCLPFEHLHHAITYVLSELGPLDRLGLVVSTVGGSCAWITPHKTSWGGWEIILREPYRCFDLFTAATTSILETADTLLGSPVVGVQKSIALVAGCPVTMTAVTRPVHVVGLGNYDVDLLSSTAAKSGGQFHYVSSVKDIGNVLAGIAAAERAYTHHDAQLTLVTRPGMRICDVVGSAKRSIRLTPNTLEADFGSLIAGQSRTILVAVEGDQTAANLPVLSDCQVRARSAITDLQLWETQPTISGMSAELEVFAERMARIAAAIISEGVNLVETGQVDELQMMLTRAVGAIKRATKQIPFNGKAPSHSIAELSDADGTGVLAAAQAEVLAQGLEELERQMRINARDTSFRRGMLLQASFVVQNQRAVTRRTILEQLFHDPLEINKI